MIPNAGGSVRSRAAQPQARAGCEASLAESLELDQLGRLGRAVR